MSCCFKTDVTFTGRQGFHTDVTFGGNAGFELTFEEVGGHRYDSYAGPYIVDPRFTDQTLATNGLVMEDDVLVRSILVHSVSNIQGGRTVTIGTP